MEFHLRSTAFVLCLLSLPLVVSAQQSSPQPATEAPQEQGRTLPFRTAVELALKNSAASGISRNDLKRAQAMVKQSEDYFHPTMVFGSGLGWSYGFPLTLEGSAPSIFQVNYQQGFFNLGQRENVKAAKSDAQLAQAQNIERRNEVITETALCYMQLDLLESFIPVQQQQQKAAARYQEVANQRIQAGLDSQVEFTRAKLAVARTRLDIAQARAATDQLRLRLSQLTGLAVSEIRTSTESIPKLPDVLENADLPAQAAENNTAVKIAEFAAQSKEHRAQAEHKALYPTLDFVGQYQLLSKFNNYQDFFLKFQQNNATIGGAIRFAFLNPSQHDAAKAARFDANKAREEARNVKQQVSTETLKLQRSVQQLAAAREVAQLEHELAAADVDAARSRIEAGQASIKEEQNARVAENQRYTAYLTSTFDLDKAQVQLLREIGELENWALGPKR
ncbi:MAG TPA: TolC family protein [Terriglobales bacterium]|nr:TolC family protein [Terriglobales bacterium]